MCVAFLCYRDGRTRGRLILMTSFSIRCIIIQKERQFMKDLIKSGLARNRDKFMAALPVILFFLFLFYSIIMLFGISYVILVSVVTVLFKTNYHKNFTVRQLLTLVGMPFLMALLSFLAGLNLPLCLLLNLLTPFGLVLMQASQFNQLGYFANAMFFTFLQLRPVSWENLGIQMSALAYAMAVLLLALLICSRRNRRTDNFALEKEGMLLLSKALRLKLDRDHDTGPSDRVFDILQELYKEAYNNRGFIHVVSPKGHIHYMFALLFQRAVYFLTNPSQETLWSSHSNGAGILLKELADYMEEAVKVDFCHPGLTERGSELLDRTQGSEDAPCLFTRYFLKLFLLIQDHMGKMSEPRAAWRRPRSQKPIRKLVRRIRPDTFETRFALRLSMVLMTGFAYNILSNANHGYWFALNAFLLLRPMYEDCTYRLKSRFIGTAAGCVLLQILFPLFPGTHGHFLLATIMVAGLYMEQPGTWKQALFSTCFSLTLATLAIPQNMAIGLRLLYVVMAVLLVLVINRFFFPTSLKSQFRYNLQQLFHMHHVYLRMLSDSLTKPLDYGVICEAQINYHLIHNQIRQYLGKAGGREADFAGEVLRASWYMVSEAEQMLFLINNQMIEALDVGQMDDYLMFTAVMLGEIQKMMDMKPDNTDMAATMAGYKRTMTGAPRLSALMENYSKQVSRLYLCACAYSRSRHNSH